MKKKGYRSSVLLGTPMLTERHIEIRLVWAEAYLHDDWNETIFTDETTFDLFKNKVCRWHKNGDKPYPTITKIPSKGYGMGRNFAKRKNTLILLYKHNGWPILCKNIGESTSSCYTKHV